MRLLRALHRGHRAARPQWEDPIASYSDAVLKADWRVACRDRPLWSCEAVRSGITRHHLSEGWRECLQAFLP